MENESGNEGLLVSSLSKFVINPNAVKNQQKIKNFYDFELITT
jgi:hypothetical protein